jgi:transposase
MGKLTDELAKLEGIDFSQIAKRESHPKMRIQFPALRHLQSGKTKNELVHMFQVSLTALRKWLLRFLSGGIDGLQPKVGKGRKRKLSSEREEEFRQQVEELHGSLKGGRGQNVQVLLKEKFCVDHALPSVYHVLKRCGLSWISARSKHPKSNPDAQEDFKKNPTKSSQGCSQRYSS